MSASKVRAVPIDALPWPNVRGKRCAVLRGPSSPDLASAVATRGAASVDEKLEDGVVYDVVVAWGVLDGADDAGGVAAQLRAATRGVAVSCEPIDLWSSLVGRGRPLFTADGGFNGSGHRHLLEAAGFSIERVTRPFAEPDGSRLSPFESLLLRGVTRASDRGRLHRALLARPTRA